MSTLKCLVTGCDILVDGQLHRGDLFIRDDGIYIPRYNSVPFKDDQWDIKIDKAVVSKKNSSERVIELESYYTILFTEAFAEMVRNRSLGNHTVNKVLIKRD